MVLDERGKEFASTDFAQLIAQVMLATSWLISAKFFSCLKLAANIASPIEASIVLSMSDGKAASQPR